MFEKYTASVTVGNKEVTLNLYDTAGESSRRVPLPGHPRGHPRRPPPQGPDSLCRSWRLRRGALAGSPVTLVAEGTSVTHL